MNLNQHIRIFTAGVAATALVGAVAIAVPFSTALACAPQPPKHTPAPVPTPTPKPVVTFTCSGMDVVNIDRTHFDLTAHASVQNATVTSYDFTVVNSKGKT